MKGLIIVIVSPSGGGKSSIIRNILADHPEWSLSVSHTTRPMKKNEQQGQDYFFISEPEFREMITQDLFLEYAQVHDSFYGTSKKFIHQALAASQTILLDVDVQGADAAKKIFGDQALIFFIEPPSLEELELRLRKRQRDDDSEIEMRLKNARQELLRKDDFDFCVINDQLERCVTEILARISEKRKTLARSN